VSKLSILRRCPKAPCHGRIATTVERAGTVEAACPVCNEPVKLEIPDELANERRVVRCAACPGREFFIRKDFPQKIGLLLVVVFGIVATVFYAKQQIGMTFATLATVVVIDAAIYLFVGKVTVCYRCRTEYRGVAKNPEHEGFDLATSEKYPR